MKSFETLWREADARDKREASSGFPHPMIGLECNGELVRVGSVGLVALRRTGGADVVEFVCPRCKARHWSLLLS